MLFTLRDTCAAVGLLVVSVSGAAAQSLARISVASDGAQSNGFSYHPSVSADDRFAAYDSTATNLVPGDTNGVTDIFVYDSLTRTTTRESFGPGGVQANADCTYPAISATGRFVAFNSTASNLVPGVSGAQVYVRDRQAGVTAVVSVSNAGTPANGTSGFPKVSADGRYVSYTSTADNLVPGDTNGVDDVFTRDLVLGTTTRDSAAPDGTQNSAASFLASINADARYLAFVSGFSMFVRDRVTGGVTLESLDANGQPLAFTGEGSLSADGRIVAFGRSFQNLRELYVRDRMAMQTTRIEATIGHITPPRLSTDARFVAYSFAPLGGGTASVLFYDRATGRTTSLGLMSLSYLTIERPAIGTSAVAFSSEFPLTPFDTNGRIDIFATRLIEGDLPGTPTGLAATVNGSTVALTWSASATGGPALGYVIEAGSAPGAANLANFNTGSSATSYTAAGVGAGTYFVRVRAAGALGPSAASNEIMVVVSPVCVAPSAPGNLIAVVAGSTVTLTWSGGANVSSYVLEAGSGAGQTNIIVADLGSASTTLTANGVGAGRYFVRVRSKNACGISGVSNEAVVDVR